jgi:hypothetical protein
VLSARKTLERSRSQSLQNSVVGVSSHVLNSACYFGRFAARAVRVVFNQTVCLRNGYWGEHAAR